MDSRSNQNKSNNNTAGQSSSSNHHEKSQLQNGRHLDFMNLNLSFSSRMIRMTFSYLLVFISYNLDSETLIWFSPTWYNNIGLCEHRIIPLYHSWLLYWSIAVSVDMFLLPWLIDLTWSCSFIMLNRKLGIWIDQHFVMCAVTWTLKWASFLLQKETGMSF